MEFVDMGEGAGESHSQRALVTSKFPSCLFADDVGGLLVGAESKENRVTHLAVTRPLGEFYLAYQLRQQPRGMRLIFDFSSDGFAAAAETGTAPACTGCG